MDKMTMHRLCEMCCDELAEIIEKGELTMSSLEQAHKLTDTIKNVKKIEMYSEGGERGYSRYDGHMRGGDWQASGRYGRDDRYSYDAYDGTESSRRTGMYSRHSEKEKMISQIESVMRDPEASERLKEVARRFREEIKNV